MASSTLYADMLGRIQQQQRQLYDTSYRPLAQGLIADVDSMALVDSAKESAAVDRTEMDKARTRRQQLRLGVTPTAQQTGMSEYTSTLTRGLTNEGNINTARSQQEQRNEGVRDELINVSRGIATSSMNSALNAANAEGNRNSTNANISAQNNAAEKQMYAGLASMALMVLI